MDSVSILAIVIGAVAAATVLFFIVMAAVQVSRTDSLSFVFKLVWVVLLISFPVITTMIWYLAGDRINATLTRHELMGD